ncbi:multifunctional tRNA nucleotidy [Legionella parisiensis]|uniref:Multifunctional CCA protein n=1 Tax=Legionella parisiensis TaxID=45071 RepID=A0A1E5JTU3_9GAMM|nr:multifunctional tRNA nucleotidy [Legionella parisiensis]KTD40764.1 multifunctional tRNA nucleotidy [Legionella parisiensis]OEH47932.1 Multifunctional CCA protein [Legionella parisiensis]STX76787.1 multifunctional tRNA nucleotidy [Legionella parisiensis]
MKIYLVGGAVRDKLRGFLPKDNDWVVVGTTWDDMLNMGYKPVLSSQETKDIPVFLHPETREEYALARCEKRTGVGHAGFEFDFSPAITLMDDLSRRDLTINAMAFQLEEGKLGELIDPYNGKADLEHHILRHVSSAFVEDPLRLLRTARFAACLGFQVAPETMVLMKQMVAKGTVSELSSEQIWKELERALMGEYPENFFDVLKQCGADSILFPDMDILDSSIKVLQRAVAHKDSAYARFAILMQSQSQKEISTFCKQYNIPNQYRDLALLTSKHLPQFRRVPELGAAGLLDLLTNIGAFHNKERFEHCLHIFELCTKEESYAEQLRKAFQAAKSIDTKDLASKYIGHEINRKIKVLRIEAIQQCINTPDDRHLVVGNSVV